MIWSMFALFVVVFISALVGVVWWTTDGLSGTWDEL